MLAAEAVSGAGVVMLEKLQTAYYLAFEAALETLNRHYEQSAALLAKLKGQGFPTLALQQGAKLHRFHLAKYLGKPDQFRKDLDELLAAPKRA